MKIDKLKEIILLLILILLIVFLVKYLKLIKYLKSIFIILIPLFIGFIYSWIFNPLINRMSKKINRNIFCISLFLFIVILLCLFIYFLIPLFYREILEFIELLPSYYQRIETKVEVLGFKSYLEKIVYFIVNSVPKYLITFVGSVFRYVGIVVIGLILGLYISIDYEKIVFEIYNFVPKKYKCVVVNLCKEVSEAVRKCVNGTLLIASFVFIFDTIAFFLIGLDSALLLGMICGITDLIPYVGPYFGGVVAVLVGLTESKFLGIIVFITCVVVQSVENYVLQPLVMSKSIKISPILVILSLLVFGNFFGIVGMIFATPFLATMKVIIEHFRIVLIKCKKKDT